MERDVKIFLSVIAIIFVAMFANSFLSSDGITGKTHSRSIFRSNSLPDLTVNGAKFINTSIDPNTVWPSTPGLNSVNINSDANIYFWIKTMSTGVSNFNNVQHKLVIKKDGNKVFENNYTANLGFLSIYSSGRIMVPYRFTSVGNYCLDVTTDVTDIIRESSETNNLRTNLGCVNVVDPCSPNWQCTSWDTCTSSGTQTRTCTDSNNCSVTTGRPAESQSCVASLVNTTTANGSTIYPNGSIGGMRLLGAYIYDAFGANDLLNSTMCIWPDCDVTMNLNAGKYYYLRGDSVPTSSLIIISLTQLSTGSVINSENCLNTNSCRRYTTPIPNNGFYRLRVHST